MIFNVVLERDNTILGTFALVGKQIIGAPAAQKLVGNLLDTDLPHDELATALDGYTNGYYVLRAVDLGRRQTAALHEFCQTPLHPGPCEGWKNKLPDGDPRKTRAKAAKAPAKKRAPAKAPAAGKGKAPASQTNRAPAGDTRDAGDAKPTAEQIAALPDDELFDMFARLSKEDTLDEPLMQQLIADMDRRERGAGSPPELTPEQKRVDELVAGGRDFLSAYAEVHGKDEDELKGEQGRTAVDRRPGETSAAAVRRSYDEFTHVNYLQAEKATRGHMLNKRGQADGVDPLTLFTGPISRARRYASEELMRWWSTNGRMNLTQFRAEVSGGAKDRAAAKKTRQLSNAKDFI